MATIDDFSRIVAAISGSTVVGVENFTQQCVLMPTGYTAGGLTGTKVLTASTISS